MKKNLKRTILMLLALVMAATPITAVATEESPERSMETALVAVKSLIDVDDDVYTDFNYSSSFTNYETREGLVWSFHWSDERNSSIYAQATGDGTLLSFNKYTYNEQTFGFAEINKTAAIAAADKFIRDANPRTHTYYKAPVSVHTTLHSRQYSLEYIAEVNGYSFETARISLQVDKYTGEVTSYDTRNVNPERFRFESATGLINQSAAVTAYADKIGLTLEYKGYFNYEESSVSVFPVYLFNSHQDRFISAKTGEIVEYVYDLGSDGGRGMNTGSADNMFSVAPQAEADEGSGRANITPAERAAIDQIAGFLTSEQALQKLLEAMELATLDVTTFNDQYIGLNRSYYEKDRYYYNVSMYKYIDYDAPDDDIRYISGQIDAATGRVLSFSFQYHGTPNADSAAMTETQANAAVETFLRRMAPTEMAKAAVDSIQGPSTSSYGYRSNSFYYSYYRHENDVPFRDNGISVTLNAHTRKITSYSLNWYDNLTFPSVSNVMTPQRALAAFVDQNGAKIGYITTGEGNAALVYDLKSREYIDPFTGRALDYTGKHWVDDTETPAYGDVAGHWSARYVNKLLDNGVYLWGGRFEPDRVMTELEFLQYIMLIEPSYVARMEPQDFFGQRGVNVEASADKQLTRQEAVRIIVEYLGYGKLAEQSQWFVYPFRDSVANEYKGYITICYMLGIIGGSDGNFNASRNVTRAEAATILHNLIIAKS